jgi:hypothetical protein
MHAKLPERHPHALLLPLHRALAYLPVNGAQPGTDVSDMAAVMSLRPSSQLHLPFGIDTSATDLHGGERTQR